MNADDPDLFMILKKPARMIAALTGLVTAVVFGRMTAPTAASQISIASTGCDPAFTRLFTPDGPPLGRYEACADPRPLDEIAPAGWTVELLDSADAFGGAGAYDRAALARLYAGRRARVARGWTESGDRFEAITLISPHPDATMTSLQPGTLLIRWVCDHRGPECKMLNAAR